MRPITWIKRREGDIRCSVEDPVHGWIREHKRMYLNGTLPDPIMVSQDMYLTLKEAAGILGTGLNYGYKLTFFGRTVFPDVPFIDVADPPLGIDYWVKKASPEDGQRVQDTPDGKMIRIDNAHFGSYVAGDLDALSGQKAPEPEEKKIKFREFL